MPEMEFQKVIRRRKMIRAFESRPLPREIVQRILENAQRGPSSGYTQGFEFLVFDGPEMTGRFWEHLGTQETANPVLGTKTASAPLIIVPLAHSSAYVKRYLEPDKVRAGRKTEKDWPSPYWFIDTAFAAMLILLTAVDSGLGAFYFSIGANVTSVQPFRKAFDIPDEYYPIGAIAIGYSAPGPSASSVGRGRRPKSEVMHFGRW